MNCIWINIDKGLPDDISNIVYRTINGKIMVIKDPSQWHIDKYGITHYLILPKL